MKNPDTKVLILMGVNEGVFPKTIGDQTLISDREKEKLGQIGISFDSDMSQKHMMRSFWFIGQWD